MDRITRDPEYSIEWQELEREHGRLIYSFDMQVAGIEEVNVNALNGRVVAATHEDRQTERSLSVETATRPSYTSPARDRRSDIHMQDVSSSARSAAARTRSTAPPTALAYSRPRLSLRGELTLAALPTVVVLVMLALVHTLSAQPLLTASLGASAFLIYLDPAHRTNRIHALIVSQLLALALGWGTYALFGGGYVAVAIALGGTILGMVTLDAVHPPAISTALVFALRTGSVTNVVLFAIALGVTIVLVALQRAATIAVERVERIERRVRSTPSSDT